MNADNVTPLPVKRHPIPDAALDDRLAFIGASGSGKTYNAGTAVERLLSKAARVVIVDPLGVWHGLRLKEDGKAPAFPVVIFGGEHADLPLAEQHGALIGETAATMAESCIVDLSALGTKAAERRFMLGFLTALHRKASGEPVHLVLDEADMWAPQMLRDKEGDAAKLLGMMETIVRRGRIKGFIPWLITQRPAVLSKDVLSQADGLVAMKLTSAQDRAALGDWIEGQADRAQGKRILAEMPTLQRGQGVVWVPGRGVLTTAQFPLKATFDSSRTPTRGEVKRTLTLKPLDLDALKGKLSKVEEETKANDPRALKAEVARLQRELAAREKHPAAAPTPKIDEAAIREKAWNEGHAAAWTDAFSEGRTQGFNEALDALKGAVAGIEPKAIAAPKPRPALAPPAPMMGKQVTAIAHNAPIVAQKAPPPGVTAPQAKILEALAFWRDLGFEQPLRVQVGAAAGYSPSSGGFNNLLGKLRGAGLIDYSAGGRVSLTATGEAAAPPPDERTARNRLSSILSAPQQKIVDALPHDGAPMSREDLGVETGYSPTSGGFNNILGSLRSLGVIDYPQKGLVAVELWVWS